MTFPMKVSEIVAPEAALMVTREEKVESQGFSDWSDWSSGSTIGR